LVNALDFVVIYGVPLAKEVAAELLRFGANLRRDRTARKIIPEKLAEVVDLNIRTLQKIEAVELMFSSARSWLFVRKIDAVTSLIADRSTLRY